jgi:hypothetical protein
VTLAGLEPATSPVPGEQGRSIPLELQRRHDLHHRLWRRRGAGMRINPRHDRATRWPNRRFLPPWSVEHSRSTRRRSAINPARVNSVSEAVAYRVAACAEAARDYRRLVVSRLAPEESQV